MSTVNLQTKQSTFTPQYFFQTHHKFHSYIEKAQIAVNLAKEDKTATDPNFTWWFDGSYYHVSMWCKIVNDKNETVKLADTEIFATRYQRDALIGVMFFHALFACTSAWRENWKPGGVSARGGWTFTDETNNAIPPAPKRTPVPFEQVIVAPPEKFPTERTLTQSLNLLQLEDALKDIFGCKLIDLHSAQNTLNEYERWLEDLETVSFCYIENYGEHIEWIEEQGENMTGFQFKRFIYEQAVIMKNNFSQ